MKRATGGEIVQVEGGHILRSTGKKDRHSKVYTAKGPRDRRVRLSAHTAIQFYDVQDRLGYDRPSKAVDWLIKKAKNAIDKLDELPPWNPIIDAADGSSSGNNIPLEQQQQQEFRFHRQLEENNPSGNNSSNSYMMQTHAGGETQSLGDTMKSFFPMNSGTSLMNFQNYPHEIMPRSASFQNEDLGLSLHSTTFHDHNSNHRASSSHDHQTIFSSQNFETNYSRMAGWILPHHHQQTLYSPQPQGAVFPQREPLQSNFSQLIHDWEERPPMNHVHHQAEISNRHFTSDFQIPARIHGEHEEPSSASPNSHH